MSPVVVLIACQRPTEITDVEASVSEAIGTVVTVRWSQSVEGEVAVAYSFADTTMVSPKRAGVVGHNEARLLGIPFGTEVTYAVQLGDRASEPQSIATGPLPEALPVAELLVADDTRWDGDVAYLLASVTETGADWRGPWWTVIFDRLGRIVWAWPTTTDMATIYPQVAADGTLLLDENSFWGTLDNGAASTVHRLALDGSEEAIYPLPGLHHGFVEDGSGGLVWPAWGANGETLERLSKVGVHERVWDCASLLELTGTKAVCGANTITWQPERDSFLVSFWSLDAVVEIDASTGANRRWFGNLGGAWSFDPPDACLWWPHGATYTDAGTLLVLTRSEESGNGNETIVREYAMDEGDDVLRLVWTMGKGDGIYSKALGDVHRLSSGNTLYDYGEVARVREVTTDGEIVWDVAWPSSAFLGLATPIADLYALR
jgi:hypothetical protein